MIANFSYTLPNPFLAYKKIYFNSEEKRLNYALNTFYNSNSLKYLKRLINSKTYYKHTHYRLNIRIPKCDPQSFNDYLDKETKLKGMFSNTCTSFSIHIPYNLNFYSIPNFEDILDYMEKCSIFIQHLGFKKFLTCNHLKYYNKHECLVILNQLFRQYPEYTKGFCFENCDKFSDMKECLEFCKYFNKPFIFDNFHNKLNGNYDLIKFLPDIVETWKDYQYKPFIHYSNGDSTGRHGDEIDTEELIALLKTFKYFIDELYVIVELKNARVALERFKNNTLNSLDWFKSQFSVVI